MNDFDAILGALAQAKLRILVVGGVAVVWRGYTRFTADIDVMCSFDEGSVLALKDALASCGFKPRVPVDPLDLAKPEVRADWIARNMIVLSFWSDRFPMTAVDVFVEHPIAYEDAYMRGAAVSETMPGVHVAALEDLIRLKEIAGRDIDHADLKELRRLLQERDAK